MQVADKSVKVIAILLFGALLIAGAVMLDMLLGTGTLVSLPEGVPPQLATARSRIKIGDGREEVLQALNDAWYHGDCTYNFEGNGGFDIFLYGPKSRDQVRSVIVRYKIINDRVVVDFIGSEEPNRLRLYKCVPNSIFAD